MKLCSRKRKEEGEENAAFCVLDGTVVRSLNHFLYKYIILKSIYLMNDSSSYELLALNSTRSSRQDAYITHPGGLIESSSKLSLIHI